MKPRAFCLFSFLLLFSLSCSPKPIQEISVSQAHKKFLDLCESELNLNVVTKMVGRTFYVYVPMKEDILKTKGTKDGPMRSTEYNEVPVINFVETNYKDGIFDVQYDIALKRNYPQSLGYTSTYADWYQEKQQGLLSAANRSFADLAEDEPSPQFFVLVVADIVSGVEIESILYFEDLRHGLSIAQALPQDEFLKRFVYELRGKEDIIGDNTGQHINYTDISFPQFLAKQITTRINFKYQRSSFPPSANTREELKKIIIETFDAYDYEDYSTVKLHNLAEDSTESLTSSQLSQLAKELGVSSGKFHVINFR